MGLFSSKKRTYVSSSVWNMAGDIKDRANYLKSVVMGNILFDSPTSLGEAIPSAYLNGPGMGFRRYARWAGGSSNYADDVGFVGGGITVGNSLDPATVQMEIPHGPNEYVSLNESDLGLANYTWWAEEYMVNNHPDLIFTDWFSDIDSVTNDITITFEDTTTVTFSPVGYDSSKYYLYALYKTVYGGVDGPITPGTVIIIPTELDFPGPPVDYTLYSDGDTVVPVTLDVMTVVDVAYSDATPPEHTETPSTIDTDYVVNERVYHKYTLVDTSTSTRDMYIETRGWKVVTGAPVITVVNEDIGGGVIKTTTTTVTSEELEQEYSYHDDVQDAINNNVSDYKYYRYEKDTGNAVLDAMFAAPVDIGAFLPYIPIRIDNQFIKDTNPTLYARTKQAYKKAMCGADLNDLIEKISDNDQLGDLDFIYAVYGVSLNSPENTAKEYMFRLFDGIVDANPSSGTDFTNWQTQFALADASAGDYIDWAANGGSGVSNPPPLIPYPNLPVISLTTKSTTSWMNFNMRMDMNGIVRDSGTDSFIIGNHKKGDYWFVVRDTVEYIKRYTTSSTLSGGGTGYRTETIEVEQVSLYYMDTDAHYISIDIYGLVHTNYVYDNKTVVIKGSEAMADPEESGFIIPLHEATFRSMSLVDQTQLTTASCYLVFNCYVVKKTKWYQSGFFKLLLVVAIIVVSVVFAPAGAGTAGILGSSAAVGTTLGFTGTAAIVAGTVANAIAAMIVTRALTEAFGDTWGTLLGTIVTVGLTVSGGVMGGGSFDVGSFATELSKAENLIAISDGLVKSVGAYMQEKTSKILAETQAMMERYKSDMLEVQKQYEEMFGTGTNGVIDPLMLTSASQLNLGESRGSFLERTLMCGSDVAELSQDLVRNFSDITLNLDLPM